MNRCVVTLFLASFYSVHVCIATAVPNVHEEKDKCRRKIVLINIQPK